MRARKNKSDSVLFFVSLDGRLAACRPSGSLSSSLSCSLSAGTGSLVSSSPKAVVRAGGQMATSPNYSSLHRARVRAMPPPPPQLLPPPLPLTVWRNPYGDLQTTRPEEFEREPSRFEAQLAALLARADAVRGVWLRLPFADCAALLPALARAGFLPHHAERGGAHLVLQAWLPRAAPNPTPPHAHVDVGCGALVVNARGQLLGIRERYDEEQRWGVPGGHLDPGEDWLACAAREAREETGVACVALGIVGVHETQMPWSRPPGAPLGDAQVGSDEHALRWGTTHAGVYVLCYALGEGALSPDPSEVAQAAWMDAKDWRGLPAHVRALVASAEATGHLAAAARAAAQGAPGAVPAHGLLTASALPLPSRHGGSHGHVFYHAAPPDVFARAAAAAGLGAPQRLLHEASGGQAAAAAAAAGSGSGSGSGSSGGTGAALKLQPHPQGRAAGASARAGLRLAPALGLLALGAGLLGLGYAAGKGQLQLPRLPPLPSVSLFPAKATWGR